MRLHRHKWLPVWNGQTYFHQGRVDFVCHCGAYKTILTKAKA